MKHGIKLWRLFIIPILALFVACEPLEPRQIDVENLTDSPVECTVWLNYGAEEPEDYPINGYIYPGDTGTHSLSELESKSTAGGDESNYEKNFFVACTTFEECDDPDAVDGLCARETTESATERMEPTDCIVEGTVDAPGITCQSLSDKKNDFESEYSG